MKKIKLKICNADLNDKFSFGNFFLDILRKYYEVELSESPDYVIYNDSDYEYLKYDAVRIFFTGENITPNFNLCDYATAFDYMTFGDRYYRMPLYLITQFYSDAELALARDRGFTGQKIFTKEDLAKKTGFCSFVFSNYLADPRRQQLFNKLSDYKRVDSGGGYLNNTGYRVKSKLAFEMDHKFSLECENSSSSGYITERLLNGMVAGTIPIYWGDPDAAKEFNEKRFINCHAYKNFDEVVARIKEIDQDDELYLKIINEPIAAPGYDFQTVRDGFENFLKHIFDQPLKDARRIKINTARKAILEASEILVSKNLKRKNFARKQLALLYKPFKKIPFLERLKQKTLASRVHKN